MFNSFYMLPGCIINHSAVQEPSIHWILVAKFFSGIPSWVVLCFEALHKNNIKNSDDGHKRSVTENLSGVDWLKM